MIAFNASRDQAIVDMDEIFELERPARDYSKDVAAQIINLHKVFSTETEQRPPILDSVYNIYHNTISASIMGDKHEALAMVSFEIVSHALRPLNEDEFEHALHSICRIRGLKPDNNWNVTGAIMATGCLITMQDDSVGFFQASLFTYFEKFRDRYFRKGRPEMARACLMTLMSHNPYTFIDARRAASSLFAYAACAWGKHVRACSADRDIEMLAYKYLSDADHLQVGSKVAHYMRAPGFDVVFGLGPLHVCSIFGLSSLIYRLLEASSETGVEIDGRTQTHMKTPLMYAASMGHLETVILLLELGATPSLTSAEGFTALFEAFVNNKQDVLMHFLTSATIEPYTVTVGGTRHTVLMHIRCFTTIDSVRALLKRNDIDINERDQKGFTVLSHVLFDPAPRQPGWSADVARLILAVPSFDSNAVDELRRSYIQQLLGSPRFDENLLEILLGADVDLENQDRAGETAICNAICQQPTTKAARMLLDSGANLDIRNHAHTGLIHRKWAVIWSLMP
ncbi:hypothetical protein KCU71_g18378, partial [Aureobasidium melanogenum]